MKPLLSICIPTYGHDLDLRSALTNLISLPSFKNNDEIEVVISDNCSPDHTPEVCAEFVKSWPGRIRYFRNDTNVGDANFGLSLARGEGDFLKLTNDTIVFRESGLRQMLEAVRKYRDEKPVLFFSNQEKKNFRRSCHSLSDFVDEASMWSTWIGSFGIWKSDMDGIADFARNQALYLTQVDVLCRMVVAKKRAEIFNYRFCDTFPRPDKGGYSVALIFGNYYFQILRPYLDTGDLSKRAYKAELKRMLRNQILPFSLTFSHSFDNKGYFRSIFANYWTDYMYWGAMPFVIAASILKRLKKLLAHFSTDSEGCATIPMAFHRLTFRRRNKQNSVIPHNLFRRGCVAIGKRTTGEIAIYGSHAPFARLLIGDDVTIEPGVRFLLSGEPSPDNPSGYKASASHGPIVIRDHVRIESGATICSGVIVGEGVVVTAGTIVTSDMPALHHQ